MMGRKRPGIAMTNGEFPPLTTPYDSLFSAQGSRERHRGGPG